MVVRLSVSISEQENTFITEYGLSASGLLQQRIQEVMKFHEGISQQRISKLADRLQEQIDRAERAEAELEELKKNA
jgi:molecular chaperone GrpE (heat shock protein)